MSAVVTPPAVNHDGARAASASAVLVCQGRATADGRYAVGRFSDPVARNLLDPDELAIVDRIRAEGAHSTGKQPLGYEMVRHTGVLMVPRTIAIDDALREHRAAQVVILGAGLDARAYRMEELDDVLVFEVDHEASQRDKRRRAAGLQPIAELRHVTVDLARAPLGSALTAAGFNASVPTTWVWEGVIPYLTRAATIGTLEQVVALSAPGSRLILNYQAKSLPAMVMRRLVRILLRISRQPDPFAREPWRSLWQPQQLHSVLSEHGFDVMTDEDLLTLADGLELPSDAARSMRGGRVAIARRG